MYFCAVTKLDSFHALAPCHTSNGSPRLRGEDSMGEILAFAHTPNPVIPAQAGTHPYAGTGLTPA